MTVFGLKDQHHLVTNQFSPVLLINITNLLNATLLLTCDGCNGLNDHITHSPASNVLVQYCWSLQVCLATQRGLSGAQGLVSRLFLGHVNYKEEGRNGKAKEVSLFTFGLWEAESPLQPGPSMRDNSPKGNHRDPRPSLWNKIASLFVSVMMDNISWCVSQYHWLTCMHEIMFEKGDPPSSTFCLSQWCFDTQQHMNTYVMSIHAVGSNTGKNMT